LTWIKERAVASRTFYHDGTALGGSSFQHQARTSVTPADKLTPPAGVTFTSHSCAALRFFDFAFGGLREKTAQNEKLPCGGLSEI